MNKVCFFYAHIHNAQVRHASHLNVAIKYVRICLNAKKDFFAHNTVYLGYPSRNITIKKKHQYIPIKDAYSKSIVSIS